MVALGWHELAGDWRALLERGLLAPAERVLTEDLSALTEEHFAHLLPVTTLGRAGANDLRRQRRLTALMKDVMPGGNAEPTRRPGLGAVVMLDEPGRTTQRIATQQDGDALALRTWLAELKPQAQALHRPAARSASRGSWPAIPGRGQPVPACTWPFGTPRQPSART